MSVVGVRPWCSAVLTAILVCTVGSAEAQVLPLEPGPAPGTAAARYQQEVRSELERSLQEWVNALEQDDPALVSRFYTDDAVILTPAGELVRGREAAASYWARTLPELSHVELVLGDVIARNQVAAASAVFQARVAGSGGQEIRTGHLMLVFERQRGVWMQHLQAAATDPERRGDGSRLGGAIRPTEREARPPELVQLRWTMESNATAIGLANELGGGWHALAGIGIGLELGRILDVRGTAGHGIGGGPRGEALRHYGAELRVSPLPGSRVRPYIVGGASYLFGAGESESPGVAPRVDAFTPLYGAGLVIDLGSSWALQLAARAYLTLDPDSPQRNHWMTEPRVRNNALSVGVSHSIGGHRTWRDPPTSPERQLYETVVGGELAAVLEQWLAWRQSGETDKLVSVYVPDAWLLSGSGEVVRGGGAIAAYLRGQTPPGGEERLVVEDIRASGSFALVVSRLVSDGIGSVGAGAEATTRYVSVFERRGDRWMIRMHVISEQSTGRA